VYIFNSLWVLSGATVKSWIVKCKCRGLILESSLRVKMLKG
jgi:hypothetical protein